MSRPSSVPIAGSRTARIRITAPFRTVAHRFAYFADAEWSYLFLGYSKTDSEPASFRKLVQSFEPLNVAEAAPGSE